jgi:hypothetical protein
MIRLRWLPVVLAAGVLAGFVLVLMCRPAMVEPNYYGGLGRFDLGHGREVRVWRQPHFGEQSSLWFEAARDGRPLRPRYCLGRAHGCYDVKTAWSTDRAVSCTYSAGDPVDFVVYCDWATGDVWPSRDYEKLPKWQAVYRQLRAANPDMPQDRTLEPAEPEPLRQGGR